MNKSEQEKKSIKQKIKFFSDSMFRNYQVMRKRWEISNAEKKRSVEISRLGNIVYRLCQKDELTADKVSSQVKKIEKIVLEIKNLEETLRDILMRADEPRQLQAGSSVVTDTPVEKTPQEKIKVLEKPVKSSIQKTEITLPVTKQAAPPADNKNVKPTMTTDKQSESKGRESENTKTVDKTASESIEKKTAPKSAPKKGVTKPAAKAPAKKKTEAAKKTVESKMPKAEK